MKRDETMKLQLALDRLTRDECLKVLKDTEKEIDNIEVGTGVIKEYGMSIIREVKRLYPDKTLVADMKTCDAGRHETLQAFDAGADITTVMAFSSDVTIKDTLNVADQTDNQVMVDLLEITNRGTVIMLKELGVNLVSLHVGKDRQTEGSFNTTLFSLVKGLNLHVTVAGGINLETLQDIIIEKPDTVIVGSAITGAENPKEVAAEMRKMINRA